MKSQFHLDLEKANTYEQAFANHLQTKYSCSTEVSTGYFPDYDISCTGSTRHKNKVTTFEVKYNDNYNNNTVVIEVAKSINGVKEPSGLYTTKADYYTMVFKDDPNWYIIPTAKLKELVEAKTLFNTQIIWTKKHYLLYIFDKLFFLQHCKQI